MGRLFLLLPVHIGKAPENRPIPKLLCQLQIVVAVFTLGRAIKLRHLFAGCLLVQVFQLRQLLLKLFFSHLAHIRMMVAVVPDDMSLRPHPFDQIGIFFQIIPYNKKSRRHMMLFQCVENRRRVAVFVSAVKRQIQNLFRRILRIKRIILRQLLHIFVRHRRFVVLLKGKSPVLLCRTCHHRLIPYAHRMSHNASEAERYAENQTQGKHRF